MNLCSIPGRGQSFLYSSKLTTLTEVLPCFFLSCKANARVKTRKDGARPSLFLIVVLFYVFFVFYVFLWCAMYCLFCDVLCIVCVYMCTDYCHRVATQLQLNISYQNFQTGSWANVSAKFLMDCVRQKCQVLQIFFPPVTKTCAH